MAASVNKVILIGNLGRDPEVRYSAAGNPVCTISLATKYTRKDKATGEKTDAVEWHRVVLYDRLAEIAGQYLKKGRPLYIEGHNKTRKWQDKDGREIYTTEVIADNLQLLGGRDEGGAPARPVGAAAQRQRSAPSSAASFGDMDDDVPF